MSDPKDRIRQILRDAVPPEYRSMLDDKIVQCKGCKQKNRVRGLAKGPRCGKCGLPL